MVWANFYTFSVLCFNSQPTMVVGIFWRVFCFNSENILNQTIRIFISIFCAREIETNISVIVKFIICALSLMRIKL